MPTPPLQHSTMRAATACTALLLFLSTMHSASAYARVPHRPAPNRLRWPRMASLGDIRSDIEQMTRLLYENRAATMGVLARKRQLFAGIPPISTKENRWLNERFANLTKKEEDIQSELQRLIVLALHQQINKSL
jgi:hypothetical protein